ncbi:MAG: hypothetical protein IRY85_04220 [Micromonosporaceae bacterium]|nr:hypothetical protein [Micromonosporaceae bacterium]
MVAIALHHTAEIPHPVLASVRTLVELASDGRFTDQDWDHALGGLHATATSGDPRRPRHCPQWRVTRPRGRVRG